MSDRDTMSAEMASMLKRSSYTTQIEACISHAIRELQDDLFFFRETKSLNFTCVVGQVYYDEDDDEDIGLLSNFDAIHARIGSTDHPLKRIRSINEFELLNDGNTANGQPTHFIHYAKSIGLYRPPDSTYVVTLMGGYDAAEPATGDEANNPWMVEGYLLTMYKALEIINLTYIDAPDRATAYNALATRERNRLNKKSGRLKKTNRLKPTQF